MAYTSLLSHWPPQVSNHELKELTSQAASYAVTHGLQYLPTNPTADCSNTPASAIHAPMTLFPTPFPRRLFDHARKLQKIYNVLYARIAMDEDFIDEIVGGLHDPDDFVFQLWKHWKALAREDIVQPYTLGIFRSDYLLHEPANSADKPILLKQVEFNTMSASFGALSERTAAMHRYLHASGHYFNRSPVLTAENFPVNNTIANIVEGLAAAHKLYNVPGTKILFVVLANERNIFDQRLLEYELFEKHSIGVVRQTFDQLADNIRLDNPTQRLYISSDDSHSPINSLEISTVYFRAGYSADDYANPSHYEIRFLLERSLAIKCPSIPLHLAGSKKVQQALFTQPRRLESLLCDVEKWGEDDIFQKEDLDELRASWMGMWALDQDEPSPSDPGGDAGQATPATEKFGIRRARELAHSIVLKPFREGGGHNIFKEAVPAFLDSLPSEKRSAWIAQELITPPSGMANLLLRSNEESRKATKTETVSELGIFGWNLFHRTKGMKEKEAGWLVRTKNKGVNEGGVATGFAVLDSVVLVDD